MDAGNVVVTYAPTTIGAGNYTFPDNVLWKEGPAYLLGVITMIMTFAMLLGNGLVISILVLRKSVRSPSNIIIGATSLNDGFTALLYLVFVTISCFTNNWLGGDTGHWCTFSGAYAMISVKVTYINVTMIAVERFISIRFPLSYRRLCSNKKVVGTIIISWLLAGGSALLVIFLQDNTVGAKEGFSNVRYVHHYKQCVIYFEAKVYEMYELVYNLSLSAIMIVCNGYVLFVIRYHVVNMNKQAMCAVRNANSKNFTPVYIKALTTAILVVTVFVISWIPYYIVYITYSRASDEFKAKHGDDLIFLYDATWWLTYLGPIVNPYLFAFRLESFRNVIKEWLCSDKISLYELQSKTLGGNNIDSNSRLDHSHTMTRPIGYKRSNQSLNLNDYSPKVMRTYSTQAISGLSLGLTI